MSELKLRRLTEHNQRLREDLARPRVRVSEASQRCVLVVRFGAGVRTEMLCSLIRFCKTTKDHLVSTCGTSRAWLEYMLTPLVDTVSMGACEQKRGSIRTPSTRLQLHDNVIALHALSCHSSSTPTNPKSKMISIVEKVLYLYLGVSLALFEPAIDAYTVLSFYSVTTLVTPLIPHPVVDQIANHSSS